jgi:outer membrane protein OmpA-like peptidoglycan-associated protein
MFIRHSVLILVTTAMLTGCASLYDTDDPKSQTKRGAVIGAAIGAVAGIFVGDGEADEILASAAIGAGLGAGIGAYMDKQQRELEQIEGVEIERIDTETLQVHFDSDILFAVDSAILSNDSKYALDDFSHVMNEYTKTAIVIQGHTDSTGSEEYNERLSLRRANSVFNHLAAREVNVDRMVALGYGESEPVADNATAEGRSYNRRVTILVKGKA